MSNETSKPNIYNMQLHTLIPITGLYSVVRVPGGWIYLFNGSSIPLFVPYNDEFDTDAD